MAVASCQLPAYAVHPVPMFHAIIHGPLCPNYAPFSFVWGNLCNYSFRPCLIAYSLNMASLLYYGFNNIHINSHMPYNFSQFSFHSTYGSSPFPQLLFYILLSNYKIIKILAQYIRMLSQWFCRSLFWCLKRENLSTLSTGCKLLWWLPTLERRNFHQRWDIR